MEDLEKKAKLANLIESASYNAQCLATTAQLFSSCVTDITSCNEAKFSQSEKAASIYLEVVKTFVHNIEYIFCDIHNYIDESC